MKRTNYTLKTTANNRNMFITHFEDNTVFVNCSAIAAYDKIDDDLKLRDEGNAIVQALEKIAPHVAFEAVLTYFRHRGYSVCKVEIVND